jgi:phosphotransferase system HPr (HPr) family protein
MTATVRNAAGIHCRPSAVIVKSLADYEGQVTIEKDGKRSDLRSVISLISLALTEGQQVTVRVKGPDEEAVCRSVVELIETHFDFPPR